ncbi:Thioredoxin [Escovopsis weberi]|uniref:Thioredoxin n=1 Tax=Escovopsis weberi TaxID=150374 RepID=A0A0M8N125_ESCWE|nr:Thioredoxin [Escovopsis weberi]
MNSARLLRSAARLTQRGVAPPARFFHASRAVSAVHQVKTIEEFFTAIGEHDKVLVDCFAEWCGPCKAISPILEKLSDESEFKDKVRFVKFDVDQLPELSQELGVRAMPTFLFFRGGEKVHEMVGANPGGLLQALRQHHA